MGSSTSSMLTEQQLADYRTSGYVVIRDAVDAEQTRTARQIVQHEVRSNPFPARMAYPERGKYTVGGNRMAVPGLASTAEHPTVVGGIESVLGQPAHIEAFVAYLRAPGDEGGAAHCDYKRWRPVGSSMNWAFAVIPLTDFDAAYGPLLVSPGSHLLLQVVDSEAHILDLTRPNIEQLPEFVDPELREGDLLLMNGRTWHKAPPGTTSEDRCGIFHKYSAVNAPPAAGHYPYNEAAYASLSDAGKRLLPVHFDAPLADTRLLIESTAGPEPSYLVVNTNGGDWQLPGGAGWEEAGAGWDVGARIGAVQSLVKTQLGVEIPWASYIEDVVLADGVTRVYGYADDELQAGALARCDWRSEERLVADLGAQHDICRAVRTWHRQDVIRGAGKGIHQMDAQFD